jgi:hypothetical protein
MRGLRLAYLFLALLVAVPLSAQRQRTEQTERTLPVQEEHSAPSGTSAAKTIYSPPYREGLGGGSKGLGGGSAYRSDAIRFNLQFLRDHYDLRYNTMKKTTEFRPKSAAPSASVITPLPVGGGAGGEASPLPNWGGAGGEASPLPVGGGDGGGAVSGESSWHPITDRDLNALTVAQLLAGGQSWSYGMRQTFLWEAVFWIAVLQLRT